MSDTIPFDHIITGDRARNAKEYGELKPLCDSIKAVGLVHPIVLSKRPDGKYDLVAGGRRHKAMKKLGVEKLHHGVTLDPERLGFVFADEVPEDIRKEAELDENLHRLNMNWIDNVLLAASIHELKKAKNGKKWGLRQTAELLGKGYGLGSISYVLRVADLLRKKDKDVLACKNLTEAISILIKRKEDEALAELQRRSAEKLKQQKTKTSNGTSSFLETLSVSLSVKKEPTPVAASESKALDSVLSLIQPAPAAVEKAPSVEIPLSSMFLLGESVKEDGSAGVLSTFPDVFFDHIVTDIPYGIDMDNLDEKMVADVRDEHDVENNILLMRPFLQEAFRLLRSGGFCVFFYDLDHHEKLQNYARSAGFRVQRWPLVAHKTSACRNQAAQYNTTKNFEVAMVLRKDEKTVLRSAQTSSVWSGDFSAERKLYANPFAKPFELWKWIYNMISFPGQSVLDPFCGEMSACRAAANCGLVPYGVEKKETHFNRGLQHMKSAYALIHKSNATFV